jgi:hypothetical protein
MAETLTCIKCEKQLKNFASDMHHPNDGLAFYTLGHYGSSYFDPMDGSFLELTICDECVKEADDKGLVGRRKPNKPFAWRA